MKNSGEAKLLLIMAAFVVLGGGALVWMNHGGGAETPSASQSPGATPPAVVWDDAKFKQIADGAKHTEGPADAPFTLVEFADFECPSCRKTFNDSIKKIEKSGRIRLVFHHFPWPYHTNAVPAALAVEAASDQGKFWPMYDALFQNEEAELTDTYISNLAKGVGVDMAKFDKDRSTNHALMSRIDDDKALGQKLGVNSTPTIVIRDNKTGTLASAAGAAEFARFVPWILGQSATPPPAAAPTPAPGAPPSDAPPAPTATTTSAPAPSASPTTAVIAPSASPAAAAPAPSTH